MEENRKGKSASLHFPCVAIPKNKKEKMNKTSVKNAIWLKMYEYFGGP